MFKLVAVLIVAHALSDFLLQPDELVRRKHHLGYLLLHAAIHAAVSYVVLQLWLCWWIPLFILLVHGLIDLAKQQWGSDSAEAFVVDQAAHVVSLFALAWWLTRVVGVAGFSGLGFRPLVFFGGYIATVQGGGFLIAKFAKKLMERNGLEPKGLLHGGILIGQLERTLIFLFVLIGQPAGIGFLVAAKSILRFEEAKEQKWAEYVLIGTLMSFSLAIAMATLTKWVLDF